MDIQLIISVLAGILTLLILILYLRIPAFIALLIASILAGLLSGLSAAEVISTVQTGMGSTLGFVATVVGLGALFGALLEHSGGAHSIANYLLRSFGEKNASWAMVVTGFVVAIPVFFDVAFIILAPVLYALQAKSKKSLLMYAIPLLAGLAITHAFIPPTPGPVAVADILGADLGWVILIGFIAGIPTMIVSGVLFGKHISRKIHIEAPGPVTSRDEKTPPVYAIILIILIPILLIVINTLVTSGIIPSPNKFLSDAIQLLGHPFTALIIANLMAWYVLGIRRGHKAKELLTVTTKSLAPAGTIILLTGAGGVFKQVLVTTGAGELLATSLSEAGFPIILFAFLAAVLVRILQGSATVAMITAAGLVAPLLESLAFSGPQLAVLVIAIASGASILSHVNDSGFWLVKEYLGLTERQTFRSWTLMTTLLACTGFLCAWVIFLVVS